jgi:hypothetical protein
MKIISPVCSKHLISPVCSKHLIIFKVLAEVKFTITALIFHPPQKDKKERVKEKKKERKGNQYDRMTERR